MALGKGVNYKKIILHEKVAVDARSISLYLVEAIFERCCLVRDCIKYYLRAYVVFVALVLWLSTQFFLTNTIKITFVQHFLFDILGPLPRDI